MSERKKENGRCWLRSLWSCRSRVSLLVCLEGALRDVGLARKHSALVCVSASVRATFQVGPSSAVFILIPVIT